MCARHCSANARAVVRPSRIILGLLLAYQALFLNVILPGHTRGAITLDGKHTAARCCCCCGSDDRPAGKAPAVPSQRDREHCAICQFAAGITSVPVLYLKLAEAGLVERLPPPRPSVVVSLDRICTYLACGPPAAQT